MPRTDFNTLFQQIQGRIPGDLFALVNTLACYQTSTSKALEVTVDKNFCTGSLADPVPTGNKSGDLTYQTTNKDGELKTLNIQAWIEGIGAQSPSPDLLTTFDKAIDRSIRGLGTTTERMFNSQRSVSLFEFRDLGDVKTSQIEHFMTKVDQSIQKLHTDFAIVPGGTKTLRTIRRQASDGSACTTSIASPSSTPIPQCYTYADPSKIPYNVFYGSPTGSTDVFGNFCKAVDAAASQPLNWTTDASGNQKTSASRLVRRTPLPSPGSYSNSGFSLTWSPSSSGKTCSSNCHDAFVRINESPCGHQGGQSNDMRKSASLDVVCGIYSYTITTAPKKVSDLCRD